VIDEQLKQAEQRANAAKAEVVAICNGKRWRMCVPVEQTDSDICIMGSINDVPALVAEVRRLREALAPFQSGEWGKVKAWIVAGAPTEEQGIKAAKHLTHLNVMVDNVLNGGAS
jgi:acyl-CoA hydrolase